MAKFARAGEMRTPVTFFSVSRDTDENGIPTEAFAPVFGTAEDPIPVFGRWVSAYGAEVLTAMSMGLREPATFTCRYSPAINSTLIAYKGNDAEPYEVISVNNVEDKNQFCEIKLQRMGAAR